MKGNATLFLVLGLAAGVVVALALKGKPAAAPPAKQSNGWDLGIAGLGAALDVYQNWGN